MNVAQSSNIIPLPIDSHLKDIVDVIAKEAWTLVQASPGAGKTTRVPVALQKAFQRKVLILEPRRLAAKMQATRIAEELGVKLGEEVGYVFKGEKAISDKTNILFVTEGTFLRFYENDPLLREFGLIILDEFHERHLETDAAFYFLKKTMEKRADLKTVIMSATLNIDLLKKSITTMGEYNVHLPPFERFTHYLPNTPSILNRELALKVKDIITEKCLTDLSQELRGILVFLPGKKEIEACYQTLHQTPLITENFDLAILHGELSKEEQLFALKPSILPKKKIVLATNIAESSLTIPYVNVVIDSGLERQLQANLLTSFGELVTKKIDRASAEQRAGRSNRTSIGHVYRLYSELDYQSRPAHKEAEIFRTPLNELFLSILQSHNIIERHLFLESPKEFQEKMTLKSLQTLGLTDNENQLKAWGKKVTGPFPLRLNLVLSTLDEINENDFFLLQEILLAHVPPIYRRDFSLVLKKKITTKAKTLNLDHLLLTGFFDLVGLNNNQRITLHNGETFEVVNEKKAELNQVTPDQVVIVFNISPQNLVTDFYPIAKKELLHFSDRLCTETKEEIANEKKKMVTALKLGLIVIDEKIEYLETNEFDRETIIRNKLQELIHEFKISGLYRRLQFFDHFFAKEDHLENYDWTTFTEVFLLEFLDLKVIEQSHIDYFISELTQDILNFLAPEKANSFQQLFPEFLNFTDRRKTPLHYEIHGDQYMIFVESYLQDFYGLKTSPLIAEGKVQLTFKLLGPHKRALQVTKDLASFWKGAYQEMYKELTREYPRHHWPLDPEKAPPILLKRQLPPTN